MAGPPVILLVLASVLILALLVGVITIWKWRRNEPGLRTSNYRTFFYMGLVWLPFGIFFWWRFDQMTFLAMGILFTALGLAKRKQWNKSEEMPAVIRGRFRLAVVGGLVLFFILTALFLFIR